MSSTSTALEELLRWCASGGTWTLLGAPPAAGGPLTVALLTCDGGEEMQRLTSADPAFTAYVRRGEH